MSGTGHDWVGDVDGMLLENVVGRGEMDGRGPHEPETVLGVDDPRFADHNEAVHLCCLLIEHSFTKFRSSHRCNGLLVVLSGLRLTHTELNNANVIKKMNDLQKDLQDGAFQCKN